MRLRHVRAVRRSRAARGARACGLLCAVVAGVAVAPAARATTCGRPDLLETLPRDNAQGVPTNATLVAHYAASAEWDREQVAVTLNGVTVEGEPVWDGTQGLLKFKPAAPLEAGDYLVVWPTLRGLNTAAPGLGATVHLTVGSIEDVTPPTFEGLTGVTWDLERKKNDCTDSLENRFVFTLALAPGDDDGGRDNLTLVVFQSSGSGVDGGSVPVLEMAMPAAGKSVDVKLPVADVTGHVCFEAIARDLTDKVSDSGSHEVCVDTIAPPFFRGCAFAAGAERADGAAALAFGVLVVLVAGARRSRST
jgi:hypothetical protein